MRTRRACWSRKCAEHARLRRGLENAPDGVILDALARLRQELVELLGVSEEVGGNRRKRLAAKERHDALQAIRPAYIWQQTRRVSLNDPRYSRKECGAHS